MVIIPCPVTRGIREVNTGLVAVLLVHPRRIEELAEARQEDSVSAWCPIAAIIFRLHLSLAAIGLLEEIVALGARSRASKSTELC
jgi:hypothetical protein